MSSIVMFSMGFVLGIYIITQIERNVSTRIRRKKMCDNINKLDKKKKDD